MAATPSHAEGDSTIIGSGNKTLHKMLCMIRWLAASYYF